MKVTENDACGLEMRKVAKAQIATRVTEMLDRVQLGAMTDRLPKQLSGGQQQRVALVINPDVLMLDEPLSALDAKLRRDLRVQIRQLQQSLNLTTVLVTHDQEEALSMADRLVVMSAGRVEQIGTPSKLCEPPRPPSWPTSSASRTSSTARPSRQTAAAGCRSPARARPAAATRFWRSAPNGSAGGRSRPP